MEELIIELVDDGVYDDGIDDGRPKITRAAELEGSNLKLKLLNMTDGEAYEYLNNMKLESYQEGYTDCLRKD